MERLEDVVPTRWLPSRRKTGGSETTLDGLTGYFLDCHLPLARVPLHKIRHGSKADATVGVLECYACSRHQWRHNDRSRPSVITVFVTSCALVDANTTRPQRGRRPGRLPEYRVKVPIVFRCLSYFSHLRYTPHRANTLDVVISTFTPGKILNNYYLCYFRSTICRSSSSSSVYISLSERFRFVEFLLDQTLVFKRINMYYFITWSVWLFMLWTAADLVVRSWPRRYSLSR